MRPQGIVGEVCLFNGRTLGWVVSYCHITNRCGVVPYPDGLEHPWMISSLKRHAEWVGCMLFQDESGRLVPPLGMVDQ
jgi:hypothetical protein